MNIDMIQELKRVRQNLSNAEVRGLPATLTLEEWLAILEQYQGMCAYCLTTPFEALDHLIPLTVGEDGTVATNCLPSCKSCNSRKGGYYEALPLSPTERLDRVRFLVQSDLPIPRAAYPTTVELPPIKARPLLRLTEQDLAIIQKLKQHHGVTSTNEIIRMALHAAERELPPSPSPKQGSRTSSPL
jgi:HNH endonuclease